MYFLRDHPGVELGDEPLIIEPADPIAEEPSGLSVALGVASGVLLLHGLYREVNTHGKHIGKEYLLGFAISGAALLLR